MKCFWDSSAVIPLVLEEPRSERVLEIWKKSDCDWAWDWMMIEAEAALSRRGSSPEVWREWVDIHQQFQTVELDALRLPALRIMNRSLKLRAADAGHVFVFDRLLESIPDLTMVTFDREMLESLDQLALPIHPDCR